MCEFHLHGGVVERDERGEQVQVASGEHQRKQELALSGDACEERPRSFKQ